MSQQIPMSEHPEVFVIVSARRYFEYVSETAIHETLKFLVQNLHGCPEFPIRNKMIYKCCKSLSWCLRMSLRWQKWWSLASLLGLSERFVLIKGFIFYPPGIPSCSILLNVWTYAGICELLCHRHSTSPLIFVFFCFEYRLLIGFVILWPYTLDHLEW